jgi:hypothetical protein
MPTLPILHNRPLTSPSPWYSCAMHAIPPCPPTVTMSNLFALGHRRHPSSLHMLCALYRTILQCLPPLFLYTPTPIVECFHNNFNSFLVPLSLINCINTIVASAFITPYPSACIAQFEGPTLFEICL